jgi:iron complex outermembrane receptor protein
MGNGATAQDATPAPPSTQLPEITVTAPSPIVRRKPVVASRTPARGARAVPAPDREPAPQPAAVATAPQQGVLPIVTDQFATVTVVPNEEIRRAGGATLGDLLFSRPGITGSSFSPGSSSRPIIRGLENNRVGIVENGVGGGGVSDLGEDHFVPIDPLATSQIEVRAWPRGADTAHLDRRRGQRGEQPDPGSPALLRGGPFPELWPAGQGATGDCVVAGLRHGRDANRRQLGRSRRRRRHSARCRRRQFRGSCRRLWPQGRRLQHPGLSVSVRPDPAGQRPPAEFRSAGRRRVGRRLLCLPRRLHRRRDHANDALYRIPGIDGADHQTRIDARQTKFSAKGEYRPDAAAIEAVRFWAGATDYKHNEIGFDPLDPATSGVRQTFTSKEQEGPCRTGS